MPPTPIRRGGLRVSKDTRAVRCWRIWSSMSLVLIFDDLQERRKPRLALALPAATTLRRRSEEHTSELQSLMRNSYAVFCLNKQKTHHTTNSKTTPKYHRRRPQK